MVSITTQTVCLINGEIARPEISIYDLGFIRGYNVFEYLRTYGGKPFRLEDHLERLERSVRAVGLDLPKPLEAIGDDVVRAIALGEFAEAGIKIVVTGGMSSDQMTYEGRPSLVILAYPHVPYPKWCYDQGVHLVTVPFERPFFESKTLFYLPAVQAMQTARQQGGDDALFVSRDGMILETGTANFFAVKKGRIITPCSGVLEGITRKVVFEITRCEEDELYLKDVEAFDGAFITASNKEVMPVTKINDIDIALSRDVRLVMAAFQEYIKNFLKI